jgi:EAL and modified HD-GYP domain-containing signal transduction protein
MGLVSFFRGLFGGRPETQSFDDPFGSKVLPSAVPPAPPPPKRDPQLNVRRDEVIGDKARLAGYRFSVRRSGRGCACTPSAMIEALLADNVHVLAQRRMALIPISPDDWLAADFSPLIAPRTTFLVSVTTSDTPVPVLQAIRSAGGRTAMDSADVARHPDVLPLLNAVSIDYTAYSLEGFLGLAATLKHTHPELDLIADHIGSWPEHRMAQGAGVHYSLGGFAASPDEDEVKKNINQNRLVLIEMTNLLRREADLAELEEVAKRDPGVAVKLVEMANSPLAGLTSPVASLNQALMMLGREAMFRFLSLGIYRSAGRPLDETLLELALRRARFMELIGQHIRSKKECDELFLVGMLSMIDSLLGMPMDKVLERMTLPTVIIDVLLRSEGPYGHFLLLAMSVERGRDNQIPRLAEDLGVTVETIHDCSREAFAWTEAAMDAH